jgi:hypothetical protein
MPAGKTVTASGYNTSILEGIQSSEGWWEVEVGGESDAEIAVWARRALLKKYEERKRLKVVHCTYVGFT